MINFKCGTILEYLQREVKMSLDVNLSEPDEFNCIELHSCIEEIAKAKSINNFVYHVEFICGRGENYVANIFRVSINDSEKPEKGISVVVKTLINTTRQELFHELHKREVYAYKNVIEKFKAIQNHLNENDQVYLPDYVFSRVERGNEIIILDDLKLKGFESVDKNSGSSIDFNQVSDTIKALAKFHALSFAYEKQDPEEFGQLKSQYKDLIFEESFLNRSKLRTYLFESFDMSLKVITDLDAKRDLERISKKLLELFRFYITPRAGSVLCHGDFWRNNIMFDYKEEEQPRICILDFQAMRYAAPVTDIMYFIYLNTNAAFRSEYFERLQEIYYDSLKSFLCLFDIDVHLLYSEEQFRSDIEEFQPFGLLTALVQLRVVTAVDEDMLRADTTSQAENRETVGELENFKSMINDVVNESMEKGVLNKLIDKIK